jgi:hypothetical protein
MYGADYRDSVGEPGVHVLPSNQSTILADSRTRENPNSSVMNFTMNCDRIRMKEFYYNTLYWKQSLFTHNLTNCELVYQFNYQGVESPVYTCYAMPFVTYTSFDGNPAGSVYAAPNTNVVSYARQMEWALNNDYRLYTANAIRKFNQYQGDGWGPVAGVNVFFRYNTSRGFALWAAPVNTGLGTVVQVKILQCNWIQKGYHIHGFGYPYPVYQPANASSNPVNIQAPVYGPNPNGYVHVYYAESQPTLLPFRYVVVLSPELTKDRRIPSFHSGNVSGFNNEIAVFPLILSNSNVWHAEKANDDSTVVSIRENYSPQSATFIVANEFGDALTTDTVLSTLLNNSGCPLTDRLNMMSNSTSYGGSRVSPAILNMLLFNVASSYATATRLSIVLTNNVYGNAASDALPDDVCHTLTAVIKDN